MDHLTFLEGGLGFYIKPDFFLSCKLSKNIFFQSIQSKNIFFNVILAEDEARIFFLATVTCTQGKRVYFYFRMSSLPV